MKYKEYFCFYILFIMILFSCTSKTHLKKIDFYMDKQRNYIPISIRFIKSRLIMEIYDKK